MDDINDVMCVREKEREWQKQNKKTEVALSNKAEKKKKQKKELKYLKIKLDFYINLYT